MAKKLMSLGSFSSPEVDLMKNRLESEGIKSIIQEHDQNAYFNQYGTGSPVFGKQLLVSESDLEKAKDILDLK